MNGPLVSVIVGVYNKERFVGECLRSVLAQTYQNWELIVVDDASTDGSWRIIQETARTDARVRAVKREKNSHHPSVVRNDAVRLSKGTVLMFLDGDDAWMPEKMEAQLQWMQAHPQYRCCHSLCWKVDEEGRMLSVRHGGTLPDSGDYRKALLERMWIVISTVAVTRDLWEEVGPFNEEMQWAGEEDGEFAFRCAQHTEFGTIQNPLAKYRVSGENWTSKKWKGVGRDYLFFSHVYARPDLWQGVKARREMLLLLSDIAIEGSQYWRARGEWHRAGWFARQAVLRAPFSAMAWRQVAGVLMRRR
jgi:glycosyltransferase involved in cell wall biosynthesis